MQDQKQDPAWRQTVPRLKLAFPDRNHRHG